jgi:hypothetical protein
MNFFLLACCLFVCVMMALASEVEAMDVDDSSSSDANPLIPDQAAFVNVAPVPVVLGPVLGTPPQVPRLRVVPGAPTKAPRH